MLELFTVFFKVGLFTVGGGLAMIPIVQQEVVSRGWLTLERMADLMAVAEVTPGPFAVNMATFVGWEQHRAAGAVVATAGLVAPSFLIMVAVALCFAGFAKNRWVGAALGGVRPAVIGLIAAAAWALAALFLFPKSETGAWWRMPDLATTALFIGLAVFDWRFKPHPIALIGISMALGVLVFGVF